MKHTLEALWNGNIAPGPNCGIGDYEIEKESILADKNLEALSKIMDPNQKRLLEKYIDCKESYCSLLASQAFCDGFSLAAQLLTEALLDRPS